MQPIIGRIELMWNSGSGSQNTSPEVSSKRSQPTELVRTSCSWVMGQPFGSAVVPEVYIIMAMSRSATRLRNRCTSSTPTPSAAAAKPARSIIPAGEELPSSTTPRSSGTTSRSRAYTSDASARPGRQP